MAIYANQKDIYSCKPEKIQSPYITVSEDDYFLACRNLKASTVIVWMYMIKNHSDFKLEFSPKALQNKSGLSLNTIRQAVKELEEKKYLINVTSNIYLCFVQPVENIDKAINYYQNLVVPLPKNSSTSTKNCESTLPKIGRETSNTSNKSMSTSKGDTNVSPNLENTDSDTDSDSVVDDSNIIYRTLGDLTKEELIELQKDYRNHVSYNVLHDKYNIDRKYLNNNLDKEIASILNRLSAEEIANKNMYDDNYDLSDLPDFMNKDDGIDKNFFYNKQQKRLEEQEKEKNKKKIA